MQHYNKGNLDLRVIFLYSSLMRLAALQSDSGKYSLAHVGMSEWLFRQFGLNPMEEHAQKSISHIEVLLGSTLADSISGLIVDPLYGFELSLLGKNEAKHAVGIAWRLMEENQPTQVPNTLKGWGVEETKNAYGLAYLDLNYNPSEPQALVKKQLLFEVADYCRMEGIDLVLDLTITNSDGSRVHPEELAEIQLESLQELREAPQLFVLDYPGSVLSAATVTTELDVPWLLTPRDQEYGVFKSQLRDVLESGAKGFVAGWQMYGEIVSKRNPDMTPQWDEIEQLVKTTVRDRYLELARICEEVG